MANKFTKELHVSNAAVEHHFHQLVKHSSTVLLPSFVLNIAWSYVAKDGISKQLDVLPVNPRFLQSKTPKLFKHLMHEGTTLLSLL